MLSAPLQTVLAFGMPGPWEWIVIGILGVIIFGKRLPEVGRSLGKGIVEFKKGLKGVEDEIDDAVESTRRLDQQDPPASANLSNPAKTPADSPPSA